MADRYAIMAFFGDGGWNILLQENSENKYYFSSDTHSLDESTDMMDLFLENGGDVFRYEVPTSDIWFDKAPQDDDFFNMPPKVISGLEEYLVNKKMVHHFPCTNSTNCSECDTDILENHQYRCPKCGYYFRYQINEMNR